MNSLPDGMTLVDEQFAIGELLERSEPFRRYYADHRPKLAGLEWGTMPPPRKALGGFVPFGAAYTHKDEEAHTVTRIVLFKCYPLTLDEAPTAAHEMQHFVLDQSSFPKLAMVGAQSADFRSSADLINNLLHEPLVESAVAAYGLDIRPGYRLIVRQQIEHMNKVRSAKLNPQPLHMAFTYASLILYARVAEGTLRGNNDVSRWINHKYPADAAEGRKIVTLVDSIGFDTPDKMKACMTAIVEQYQLPNIAMQQSRLA